LSLLLAMTLYVTFMNWYSRYNLKYIFVTDSSTSTTLPTNLALPQLSLHYWKIGERYSMQLKPFRPLLRVKSVSAACPSNWSFFYPGGRQGELQWNLPIAEPRGTGLCDPLQAGFFYYSHYHAVCLTIVPQPLPKPLIQRMRSSVSSFNLRYFFRFRNIVQ
jgi:hypothetical protein